MQAAAAAAMQGHGGSNGNTNGLELDLDLDPLSPPTSPTLAAHWFMYNHFLAHHLLEQQLGNEALPVVNALTQVLPPSQALLNLRALALYCMREYDAAEGVFESARAADPYCLQHIDTYSNILYVKEDRVQVSD